MNDVVENVDSEEEFNDAVEVTDETMEEDDLPGEPERPEEGNNDMEDVRQTDEPEKAEEQPITQKKKKQPSPRERRRTRSMAAAEKRRTPIKERWLLTR